MPRKYVFINTSTPSVIKSLIRLPMGLVSNRVIVEAYGSDANSEYPQTSIPLSGSQIGTTATVCSSGLFSSKGGGSYAKSIVSVTSSTIIFACFSPFNTYIWANTTSNSPPSSCTSGVRAVNGAFLSSYATCQIGQTKYMGGYNGRRYLSAICTAPCPSTYKYICGGYGGQAGPNGPGGNGSSAYVTGNYQTCVNYLPGAGGGANGGANAVKGTPGTSRWNSSLSGSGGSPTTATQNVILPGNIDQTVYNYSQYGPHGGAGGGLLGWTCNTCSSLQPYQTTATIVVTTCLILNPITTSTYRYIFTKCSSFTSYAMCVPIGTTSTEVRVLGGGSYGGSSASVNNNCGLYTTSTMWPTAGGGGGGYARSTLVQQFTTTGNLIAIQVASARPSGNGALASPNNSSVTINGVLEARAYSSPGARGGGACATYGLNYARNGVTRVGGIGGRGYVATNVNKGGGGGGAAWDGGNGGAGYNNANSTVLGPGGGGAARCAAAGCNGQVGTTTKGGSGGNSGGVAGTGGSSSTSSTGNIGLNGGGGAGGGPGPSSVGGAGSTYQLYSSTNTYLIFNINGPVPTGVYYGPGGGGGGDYSTTSISGYGGGGGAYGGGTGGGDYVNSPPGDGLVVITFSICGALSASSIAAINTGTGASHVTMID